MYRTDEEIAASIDSRRNVEMVFERKVRNVVRNVFDPGTRTIGSVPCGEYYANAHLGYVGQEADGSWTLLTTEGEPITRNLNNRGSAKVAARRHFGPVIVA